MSRQQPSAIFRLGEHFFNVTHVIPTGKLTPGTVFYLTAITERTSSYF